MQRLRNILVVVDTHDEHQRALQRAVKISKRSGAKIKLLTVVDELPSFWQMLLPDDKGAGNVIVNARQVKLQQLAGSMGGEGVDVTFRVLRGRPVVEIVREVLRDNHDLVIKNVSAREQPQPLFFGSIDLRLLRNCPCPVWLVKPMPSRPFERILAAINAFPESDAEKQLNRQIIATAHQVVATDGSNLFLVGAWSVPRESLLDEHFSVENLMDHVGTWSQNGASYLNRLLAETGIQLKEDHICYMEGLPDRIICYETDRLRADLIVMGTVARTGINGLLMGNTAEKVLRQVECSVLTLKPEGFESPVKLQVAG